MTETKFIHTVFFWFRENPDKDIMESFEKGLEKLGTVPVIGSYYYGRAAGTSRDVVDNSYDYAWIVHFSSAADHDIYQEHPIHLEFISRFGDLWKEVRVFDTLVG